MIEIPQGSDATHAVLIDRVNHHTRMLAEQRQAIDELQAVNQRQNEILERIERSIASVIEVFSAGKGTLLFLKWFGRTLAWVAGIVSCIYGIYFAITSWPNKGG